MNNSQQHQQPEKREREKKKPRVERREPRRDKHTLVGCYNHNIAYQYTIFYMLFAYNFLSTLHWITAGAMHPSTLRVCVCVRLLHTYLLYTTHFILCSRVQICMCACTCVCARSWMFCVYRCTDDGVENTSVFAFEFRETIDRNDMDMVDGDGDGPFFHHSSENNLLKRAIFIRPMNPYKCATALFKLDSNTNSSIHGAHTVWINATSQLLLISMIHTILRLLVLHPNKIHSYLFACCFHLSSQSESFLWLFIRLAAYRM